MKYIPFFFSLLFIFSCEKEDEGSNVIPSTPTGISNNNSDLSDSTYYEVVQEDTILALAQFDKSFYGSYKGVLVNKKTSSGFIVFNTSNDSTIIVYIQINNKLTIVENIKIDLNISNSVSFSYNGAYNFILRNNLYGSNPTLTFNDGVNNYTSPIKKETSTSEVLLYLGNWSSIVKTPISTFTETGIWNLIIKEKDLSGSNSEDLLTGTNSSGVLKGTHANGDFSGNKGINSSSGTFTWSAFGIKGTGDWSTEQVSIKDLLNNQ